MIKPVINSSPISSKGQCEIALDCRGFVVLGFSLIWNISTAFLCSVGQHSSSLFDRTVPIWTLRDVSLWLDADAFWTGMLCKKSVLLGYHLWRHSCVHLFSLSRFITLKTNPNTLPYSLIYPLHSHYFFFCLSTSKLSVGNIIRP